MIDAKRKIKTIEELENIARGLRLTGKKVVTTNGCYDLLHVAHLHLLQKARDLGDELIVLLNGDKSIRRYKGDSRPFVPQEERAEMMAGLEAVSYVSVFDEDTPLDYIKRIMPHYHVKGGSYEAERVKAEKDLVSCWGGELFCFPLESHYSTTNLANTVCEKNGNGKH